MNTVDLIHKLESIHATIIKLADTFDGWGCINYEQSSEMTYWELKLFKGQDNIYRYDFDTLEELAAQVNAMAIGAMLAKGIEV